MKIKLLAFLFIVGIVLMCGSASAGFILSDGDASEPYNSGYVRITSGNYTWAEVVDYVNTTKGQTVTKNQYFEETSPGVWFVKVRIQVDAGASIDINSTDVDVFRTAYQHGGGSYTLGGSGVWLTDGVKYQCWDENDRAINVTGNRRFVFGANSIINNCIFDGVTSVYTGERYTTDGNNTMVTNTEMLNHTNGFLFHGTNITYDNDYVHDAIFVPGASGIKSNILVESDSTYNRILNCTISDIGDVELGDSSGTYGIQMEGTHNTVYNCSVDGIRYVAFNLKGNYSTFTNLVGRNATHNIMEAMASNSIYDTITLGGTTNDGEGAGYETNTAFFTALEAGETFGNVTVNNVTVEESYDGIGGAIKIVSDGGAPLDDYNYNNFVSHSGDIYIIGIQNSKFIGCDFNLSGGWSFQIDHSYNNASGYSHDIVLVDTNITDGTGNIVTSSYDISYANTIVPSLSTFSNSNYTELFPLNVRVMNTTNVPVNDANLTLTVTTFGLNGLGEYFVNVSTDENGYPETPIYVPDYFRDSVTGYTYYNLNTVTAEKAGQSDTSAAFNPDSTWYSVNSSSPNGTLITLTLDVPGEGESEYWTPTEGTHYLNVPETSTWSAGSWITTFSGTYTEEQTEVTGVEVRP